MTAPDKIWIYADTDDEGESYLELITSGAEAPTDVEYTRTDLAQAAVAAAYEAAARAEGWEAYVADTSPQYLSDWQRGLVAGQQAMRKAIRALATPDQIAALAAERAADQAEITRLRAVIAKDAAQMIEDQHKLHKAVEALRESVLAIQYLDERAPSGTTPPTLAKITAVLAEIGGA